MTRVKATMKLSSPRSAVLVALAMLLAGCSTSSETTEAPAELAPAKTTTKVASVSLAPVAAPGSVSNKMGDMLQKAVKDKDIPVKDDGADYTLRGYLVASPEPDGTKVSYIWDVTDPRGKRAHRFSGEEMVDTGGSDDPWGAVDDKAMRKIAVTTADRLHQWLPKEEGATQVATTGSVDATSTTAKPNEGEERLASSGAASSQTLVVVPEVSGAPGDGNSALPQAMRQQLASRGMKLIGEKKPDAYTVRGTVELGEADAGKQPITIRWLVLDPDGKPLKSAVVQRNKINEGSLDGSWGRIADIAAGEAAKAVAKILPDPTS